MPTSPLLSTTGDVHGDVTEEQLTSASVAAVQDSLRAAYAARDDFFSPDHIDVSSSADEDDAIAESTWRTPTASAVAASAAAASAAAAPPKPGLPRVAASNSTTIGNADAVASTGAHEAVDVLWIHGDGAGDGEGGVRVQRALSASPSFPQSPPGESMGSVARWPARQDGLYADDGGCVAVATLDRSSRGVDRKGRGRSPLVRSHSSVASLSVTHPQATKTTTTRKSSTPSGGSAPRSVPPQSRPSSSRSGAAAVPASNEGTPSLRRRGLRFRRPAADARAAATVAPPPSPAADENLLPMPAHSAAHAMVAAAAAAASPAAIAAAARVRASAGSFSAVPGSGGGVEAVGGGGATAGFDAGATRDRGSPPATGEGSAADKGTSAGGGGSAYRRLANALGKRRALAGTSAPGAEGAAPPVRASVDWQQPGSQRHSAEVWRPDAVDDLGNNGGGSRRPAPAPQRQAPWFGPPSGVADEDDASRPHRLHRLGPAVPVAGFSDASAGGGGRGTGGLLSRLRGVRRSGSGGRGGSTFPRAGGVASQPADGEFGGGLFRRPRRMGEPV